MIRCARTYGSKNYPDNLNEAWQYPTGPSTDTFGVPVQELNKTFGLEEFNFNPFFLKEKIAYVPCYATARSFPRPNLKELRLIYKTSGRCHVHYATMHDVTPILNDGINTIRAWIEPMMNQIYFNQHSKAFFADDFQHFEKIINRMKASNLIASNHNHSPFLVNVYYSELEILDEPIFCELNPSNVNQWKIRVDIPGNCNNM
jgi:hypothetical protein